MQLLIDILDDISREFNPDGGICANITETGRKYQNVQPVVDAKLLFLEIAHHWPYHSGDYNFPIPDYRPPYDASSYYRVAEALGFLWTDIQGTLRHDLIKFCHAYLTTDDFDAKSWTNEEIESYKRGEE